MESAVRELCLRGALVFVDHENQNELTADQPYIGIAIRPLVFPQPYSISQPFPYCFGSTAFDSWSRESYIASRKPGDQCIASTSSCKSFGCKCTSKRHNGMCNIISCDCALTLFVIYGQPAPRGFMR